MKQTPEEVQRLLLAYPRPAPRSWKLRRQPGSRYTLFVMRLNDRAGEMRYIDPELNRSVQADFGYVKLAGIMPA